MGVATLAAAVLPLPWRFVPLVLVLLEIPFFTLAGAPFSTLGVSALLYAQALLLGLGWALLGYALWTGMGDAGPPRHASAR